MSLAGLTAPYSRSDVRMIQQAVRRGWDVAIGRQREIIDNLKAQREDPETPSRLKTAIDECLATIAGSPTT